MMSLKKEETEPYLGRTCLNGIVIGKEEEQHTSGILNTKYGVTELFVSFQWGRIAMSHEHVVRRRSLEYLIA
jgi:hypothetical protein